MADANSKKPMALLLLVVVAVLVVIIMSEDSEKTVGECTKTTGTCSDASIKEKKQCIDNDQIWTPKDEKVEAKDKNDCNTEKGGEWSYTVKDEEACKKIDKAKWHPAKCSDPNLNEDECKTKNKWSKAICK